MTDIVIDEATCKRAGALAAHGFGDAEICEVLLITIEQLGAIKADPVYLSSLRDKLAEKADAAIDLTEGWDTLEANAVAKVMDVMNTSYDPDYALRVAIAGNRAQRRLGTKTARTIDPSKVGQILHLTLNQRFIDRQTGRAVENTIDIKTEPAEVKSLTKRVNLPTPQMVTDLLAPARPILAKIKEKKAEQLMDRLGFGSFDEDDK